MIADLLSSAGMASKPKQPTQEDLRKHVLALVPEWSDHGLGRFHYLSGGYSNHNYRFEVNQQLYVLRLPFNASQPINRARELEFYQQFHERNPPGVIPQLVTLDPSSGSMISHWQTGPLLVDEPPGPDGVITYLRRLHDCLPATSRNYDPLALSKEFLRIGRPDPAIVKLADGLSWPLVSGQPCHNDLNPWNVIRSRRSHWMTLDWEWFGNNDPLFDLIALHQGLGWTADSLPGLAAELLGHTPEKIRVRNCLTVFWLREYAWAHAAREGGNYREEIAQQKRQAGDLLKTL